VYQAARETFIQPKRRKLRDIVIDVKPTWKWIVNRRGVRKKIEFICSGYVLEQGLCNKPLCFIKTKNFAKILPDSSKEQCTTKRIRCLRYDVFVGDNIRVLAFSVSNVRINCTYVTIFLGSVHRLVFKLALK